MKLIVTQSENNHAGNFLAILDAFNYS